MKAIIKRFLIIFLALAVFFIGSTIAFADDKEANNRNNINLVTKEASGTNKDITTFIYNYLLDRYKTLGKLSDDMSFIDKYFTKSDNLYGSEYQKALLSTMIEHNKLQLSDLHFNNPSISVIIDSIEQIDNIMHINYHVKAKYKYYCMNEFTEETDNNQQAEIIHSDKYEFLTLKMLNDQNAIQFDYVINTSVGNINQNYSSDLNMGLDTGAIYDTAKKNILAISKKDADEIKKAVMSKTQNESDISLLATSYSYNRSAAVNYALQYAETYNPAYGTPGSTPDCTNYVSQCLIAGGLPQDKNGSTDQQWYFNQIGDSSYSWKRAKGLYVYLTTNNGDTSHPGVKKISPFTTKATILSSSTTGDVISYFQDGITAGATHSAIVTDILYSSIGYRTDLVLCQHSYSPNKNALFSTNLGKDDVRGEHVTTYYK